MSYINPKTVASPKNLVSNLEIIYDAGPSEDSWAVARFTWAGRPTPSIGIRWNGNPSSKGVGTPQARGVPTWFLVPEDLEDAVLSAAQELTNGTEARLRNGYEEMTRDSEREREADEWAEGLIGDASAKR